ncbi:MAG: hypothetical protein OWT28_04040 [Firmicutes bacterium]|nr:hypothetical protein [Bacillota bacterium]
MQGNELYLLIAGLVVLIVVVFLVTWTTRQLYRVDAKQGKASSRDALKKSEQMQNLVSDTPATEAPTDAEMAVSFRPAEASQGVTSATVLVDGGPPKVVTTERVDTVDTPVTAAPVSDVAETKESPDEAAAALRRQERIDAMLRELDSVVTEPSHPSASGLVEQTPPLVLDQIEAEDAMMSLGEDEIVHLSAYEARAQRSASNSDVSDSDSLALATEDVETVTLPGQPAPVDSRGLVLPPWLRQRLATSGVLGWLVVWPDGTCSSSDQVYDELVIEHFARLVNQALETASTVGLERAGEITMRGDEGAIVVAPLASYGVSTEAFVVVFVEAADVATGWLSQQAIGDLQTGS